MMWLRLCGVVLFQRPFCGLRVRLWRRIMMIWMGSLPGRRRRRVRMMKAVGVGVGLAWVGVEREMDNFNSNLMEEGELLLSLNRVEILVRFIGISLCQ
jgi:hypothetical protein